MGCDICRYKLRDAPTLFSQLYKGCLLRYAYRIDHLNIVFSRGILFLVYSTTKQKCLAARTFHLSRSSAPYGDDTKTLRASRRVFLTACLLPSSQATQTAHRWNQLTSSLTDVTGPEDAQRAVIFIYDVSGLTPQTLQGADRLKAHLAPLKTMVFVPDFLPGGYVDPEWHPPDSPEEQKASENLRAGSGDIERAVANLLKVRKEIGEKLYPAVDEHVAVGGLGWGGKVSILACGEGNEGRGRKVTVNWTAHPR